ncbi:MAG: hypothetical protein A2481_02380 [Candidatus Yonathbacteria bacterium RIFOXYC2_FULL_47_9]|nr:MAG: hypothetical protein A2481_02380 [Candidatus Yonathbacteria bacterium RIFOXYC2_FULL_47_9]HAT68545.1 hypothetical protein [Candidatus Yonathbacteria bacterium]
MELSEKAKTDLKKVLIKEVGEEKANAFSEDELNKLGLLFLNILAEGLKMKVANPELSTQVRR